MARKLVVLYDGTWNTPEDQTNVTRLARRHAAMDRNGGGWRHGPLPDHKQ